MNDRDREMWVNNDESLYNWFKSEKCGMRHFLRTHRVAIDQHILGALNMSPDTAREEGCRYERAFGDGSDVG